jgi:hypothetical protein
MCWFQTPLQQKKTSKKAVELIAAQHVYAVASNPSGAQPEGALQQMRTSTEAVALSVCTQSLLKHVEHHTA